MRIRQTSLTAYKTVDLGKRQRQVYDCIQLLSKKYGNATDKEIQMALGWEINQVVPRRKELYDKHMIVLDSERPSYIGGTNLLHCAWKVAV